MVRKFFPILLTLLFMTACSSASTKNPTTTIETTKGTIVLELFADKAPKTVENFVELARQQKYDDVPFHRVIKNFMIQTGDFTNKNGTGGYSAKGEDTMLKDEFGKGLSNVRGTISMANAGPNTNGSQFFISVRDNTYLDGKHPVFGKVISGMDVVDAIANSETGPNDRPLKEILMKKVTVKE